MPPGVAVHEYFFTTGTAGQVWTSGIYHPLPQTQGESTDRHCQDMEPLDNGHCRGHIMGKRGLKGRLLYWEGNNVFYKIIDITFDFSQAQSMGELSPKSETDQVAHWQGNVLWDAMASKNQN